MPFVPKAGGHSSWSTIGPDGFILDLSLLRQVDVDAEKGTATASAGALIGDVMEAAWQKGFVAGKLLPTSCAPRLSEILTLHALVTGTVSTVGFIPSTIGGGLTILAPLVGYGSDNVVSARLVTASGELVTASETENAELLYAIKGAGQFFGVVTSLTVKVHPISVLGNPDGIVWHATWLFDPSKALVAAEAALAVKAAEKSYCLAGVLPSPMTFEPVIMVLAVHLGRKEDAVRAFQPFLALGPDVVAADEEITYGRINDAFAAFEEKGGYKKWYAPGLTDMAQFQPEDMVYYLEQKKKIDEQFPAAKGSGFVIEFTSDGAFDEVPAEKETAFSHRDVKAYA